MTEQKEFLTPFVTRTHTGVYGAIRRDNQLLLIKKARGPYTGLYDLPGGGPEAGETFEQTLSREIKEETGCAVVRSVWRWTKTIFFSDFTKASGETGCLQHTGSLFEAEISGEPSAVGDGLDSNGAEWVNSETLSSQNATPFALMAAGKEVIALANAADWPVDVGVRRALRPDDRVPMIAAVLLFNSQGHLILQQIAFSKKTDPGKWSYSAGGHVDAGETYEEAAIRELKEEMGIDGQISAFVGKVAIQKDGRIRSFHHAFQVISDDPVIPDPTEVAAVREWTLDEVRERVQSHPEEFKDAFVQMIKQIKKA